LSKSGQQQLVHAGFDNMLLPKAQNQLSSLHDVEQGLAGLDKLMGG